MSFTHAVLLVVSNPLKHEKVLECSVTASFCYSIQNLKVNSLITDSLLEDCPLKELNSEGRTEEEAPFSRDESVGE